MKSNGVSKSAIAELAFLFTVIIIQYDCFITAVKDNHIYVNYTNKTKNTNHKCGLFHMTFYFHFCVDN